MGKCSTNEKQKKIVMENVQICDAVLCKRIVIEKKCAGAPVSVGMIYRLDLPARILPVSNFDGEGYSYHHC